jgi:hypothetical protein
MPCKHDQCTKDACFNYKGLPARYCKAHKLYDMVDVKHPRCIENDCPKRPSYNFKGTKPAKYCVDHKKLSMVDVRHDICQQDECNLIAAFNEIGNKKGIFCNEHKKDTMVNVVSKICSHEGCKIQANFNLPEIKTPQYCSKHKKDNMIDVCNTSCKFDGCTTQPSFNLAGCTSPIYCAIHKANNMVDILKKTCCFPGCSTRACFNFASMEKKYCTLHKEDGMINVVSKICQELGCTVANPVFNLPNEISGLYCKTHCKDNMINVITLTCCHEGCKTIPTFNFADQTKAIYCAKHKSQDMIDVKHNKCKECKERAFYGIPGLRVTHCRSHKTDEMIRESSKICVEDKCNNAAIYGPIGCSQKHCEQHMGEEEINLIEKKCSGCGLLYLLNDKKMCYYCDPKEGIKIRLYKQLRVKDYLDQHDLKYISSDKVINSSICGKHRPDFLFDCTTHYIVLEIDEEQHKAYKCDCKYMSQITKFSKQKLKHLIKFKHSCTCDFIRMMDIAQEIGTPTIFIRYNPDTYASKDKKKQDTTFLKRMGNLEAHLKYYMNLEIEKLAKCGFLSVMYLYFDNYDEDDIKLHTIVQYEKNK